MLRVHSQLFSRLLRLFDVATIVASYLLAVWCFDLTKGDRFTPPANIFRLAFGDLGAFVIVWLYFSAAWNVYASKRITPLSHEALIILKVVFLCCAAVLVVNTVVSPRFHGMRQLMLFAGFSLFFLLLIRVSLRSMLRFARAYGFNYRNIVIIGRNKRSVALAEKILEEEELGLRIIGYMDDVNGTANTIRFPQRVVFLGSLAELRSVLCVHIVDEVFIALPVKSFYSKIEDIIDTCTERGVGIRIAWDMFLLKNRANLIDWLDNIPLLNITVVPHDTIKMFLKRIFDVLIAGLLLTLMVPVFIIVAILIRFDSPGPVFFVQERMGCNNRRFALLKFRTMILGAETRKEELVHMNEMDGPVFKIKNDPRITRIGKYLRKTSIDELPQLINVLKGEMSLVGPRPPLAEEVKKYSWRQMRRLSIKPGITGLWQVNGRNNIPFEEWVNMDLEYIDNWSLGMDIRILLKTVVTVLNGRGAM